MPIRPLTTIDPSASLVTTETPLATDASDTPTDTTNKAQDKFVKGRAKEPKNERPLRPLDLARLFGRLASDQDEPEEKVNLDNATEQLEDLEFTPPKALPAQIIAGQKIRFGLYDRFSQSITVENRGGGRSKAYVFEYVYGHLDFEIAIDSRGRLVIDPEKIVLPFGILARESGSLISGGCYKFYDLDVVILSNSWIRAHSQLTDQKVHYAVVKDGPSIRLRRYIGPTPYELEIIHTIAASEPCARPFAVKAENRIVEPSDRRFAPRPTMRITQVPPLPRVNHPSPPAPAEPTIIVRRGAQPPQDRTHLKPAISSLFLSMDTFYGVLQHKAQFETLIASLQKFQAVELAANPVPTTVLTTKTSALDRLLDSYSPEERRAVIEILDSFAHDLFGNFFGGRRRRRKKLHPVPL